MNVTSFASGGMVLVDVECILGFSFTDAALWVEFTLLPVICAAMAQLQAKFTHFSRLKCLLPHECLA